MTLHQDLLRRALAGLPNGRKPKIAFMRRAISDAYYAVFHAAARLCADTLIGSSRRGTDAWRRVYRGLDHSRLKDELKRAALRSTSSPVQRIATAVAQLQDARHRADYDPDFDLKRRADVETLVILAADTCADLKTLSVEARQELAAALIVRGRVERKAS